MAEYGSFLYGAEGYEEGTQTETGEVTWVLQIDWEGTGLSGTNEGNRLVDVKIQRGVRDYLNTGGRGFADMRGGRADLTLDNYDRRYDPRCSTSSLYPNVEPGKTTVLDAVDNATGTHYRVFTGRLADVRPISGPGGADQVRFVVEDFMQVLMDAVCTNNATIVSTNVRDAIAHVIDDAFYPPYNLETDTQPVPVLEVGNKPAGQAINDLAHAALGYFFVRVDGMPMYYARSHTGYTDHAIDEDNIHKQILVTQPWDHVYNHVTCKVQRPYKEQTSVIYFLPYPEPITSGVDKTIYVSYAPTTDAQIDEWAANTEKNGEGTDITSDVTISDQSLGIAYGYVTFTPTATGYITQLEIRGRPYKYVNQEYIATDTTSIAKYGTKKFTLDSPFLQDPNYGDVFDDVLKDFMVNDRETIVFEIEQLPSTQFPIDIMNSISFTSATLDLDDTYYVTGIEHDWNRDTGQSVISTFYIHKIVSDSTSITASEVEVANEVPLGMGNPAGDPGTIGGYPGYPSDAVNYFFIPAIGSDSYNRFFGDDGIQGVLIASGNTDDVQGAGSVPYTGTVKVYAYVYFDGASSPFFAEEINLVEFDTLRWSDDTIIYEVNPAVQVSGGSDSNYVDVVFESDAFSVTAGDVLACELIKAGSGRVYVWGWMVVYQ